MHSLSENLKTTVLFLMESNFKIVQAQTIIILEIVSW